MVTASPTTTKESNVRVLIISDMEGVAGVVKFEQTTGGTPMHDEARRLYTEEVNAAVRGAFTGGATEVVVMDNHGAGGAWTFNSLVAELLDPRCEFVVQDRFPYTEFLEEGCDAALLVAMHASAGDPRGGMNHTSSARWQNLWFNGTRVGEIGMYAALCGAWGCPVVLVTGDTATAEEARELLGPELVTVVVKRSIRRFAARHIPPVRARALIEQAAATAVRAPTAVAPYDPGKPCEIEVEVTTSDEADRYMFHPGVERTEPRRFVARADDWWTAWKILY
jgi:D-amino peptidase